MLAVCILDMIEFPRASRAAHTGRAFAGGLPVQRGRKGSPRFLGSLYARVPCSTDPGGLVVLRIPRIRSRTTTLAFRTQRRRRQIHDWAFEAQSHGPHARYLRFAADLTNGSRKTRFRLGGSPRRAGSSRKTANEVSSLVVHFMNPPQPSLAWRTSDTGLLPSLCRSARHDRLDLIGQGTSEPSDLTPLLSTHLKKCRSVSWIVLRQPNAEIAELRVNRATKHLPARKTKSNG